MTSVHDKFEISYNTEDDSHQGPQ